MAKWELKRARTGYLCGVCSKPIYKGMSYWYRKGSRSSLKRLCRECGKFIEESLKAIISEEV